MTGSADRRPSLRVAGPTDLEGVLPLAAAFYAEDGFPTPPRELRRNLAVLLSSTSAHTAVLGVGARLVAFAVTTTGFGLESGLIAELEDLFVVPELRRGGLAGRLIEDSVGWARARGCHHLELVVAPQDRDVTHLHDYYRRRGFLDEGRRLLSRPLR